jgi:hypothetical protein
VNASCAIEGQGTHPNATELIAHLARRAAPDASGEVGPGADAGESDPARSNKA